MTIADFSYCHCVTDYPSLIGIVSLIVSNFVASSETVVEGDSLSAVIDEVLQLMLCTINRVNEMETIASQWAPIFAMKSSRYYLLFIWLYILTFFFVVLTMIVFISSLLAFLREFLEKDQSVVKAFTNNILRQDSHHSFFFIKSSLSILYLCLSN